MIVVYYGVNLSLFFFPSSSSAYAPILISISSIVLRLISSSLFPSCLHPLPVFQSRRVPPALALPLLFFFPSSSSSYATILISFSSIVLRLISSSLFPSRLHLHLPPPSFSPSRLHPLPVSLPLNLTLCLASAGLFMSSAYAPIFIPLRCLSLSFCILNCLYPASFPFLALQLISSRPLLYLIFHFLPASQSRRVPPALALPLLFIFPSSSSAGLSISPGLCPSFSFSLGYTSLLQMFRPSQI